MIKNNTKTTKVEYGAKVVASSKLIDSTPRKAGIVAQLLRKTTSVHQAFVQLAMCKKRAAMHLAKMLKNAVANAQYAYGVSPSSLIIESINVGKSMMLKRAMPRARGRSFAIKKTFSIVKMTLREFRIVNVVPQLLDTSSTATKITTTNTIPEVTDTNLVTDTIVKTVAKPVKTVKSTKIIKTNVKTNTTNKEKDDGSQS